MLFCYDSIPVVHANTVLVEISNESGPRINETKSVVLAFMGGIWHERRWERSCFNWFEYDRGESPIRYLGIPFQSRGLKCKEFQGLVAKITGSITGKLANWVMLDICVWYSLSYLVLLASGVIYCCACHSAKSGTEIMQNFLRSGVG